MKSGLILVLMSALVHSAFSQSHKYVLVSEYMNWTQAQTYCRQYYTDLATIDDMTDLNATQEIAGDAVVYIGLYRTALYAPFFWSDQSQSTFQNWAYGQPDYIENKFCVCLSKGKMHVSKCYYPYFFMCYIERKRQTVRVEVKSSKNLSNITMQEQILEKIQLKLKERGLAEGTKLWWKTQSDGNVFQKKYQTSEIPEASEKTCKRDAKK